MFLQDCRIDVGMQADIAKSDAENFIDLLAAVRKVKIKLSWSKVPPALLTGHGIHEIGGHPVLLHSADMLMSVLLLMSIRNSLQLHVLRSDVQEWDGDRDNRVGMG